MNYKLVIKSRAKQQLAVGIEWYESKQKGLGMKFLNQIEAYFNTILQNPTLYEVKRKPFREAYIRNFPYLIIYTIKDSKVVISAVFNTYQNPKQKY